jgi:hypothetical protein
MPSSGRHITILELLYCPSMGILKYYLVLNRDNLLTMSSCSVNFICLVEGDNVGSFPLAT